jgi:hypothetical protein
MGGHIVLNLVNIINQIGQHQCKLHTKCFMELGRGAWNCITTLHFLPNLQKSPVSYSITLQLAVKACKGQTL